MCSTQVWLIRPSHAFVQGSDLSYNSHLCLFGYDRSKFMQTRGHVHRNTITEPDSSFQDRKSQRLIIIIIIIISSKYKNTHLKICVIITVTVLCRSQWFRVFADFKCLRRNNKSNSESRELAINTSLYMSDLIVRQCWTSIRKGSFVTLQKLQLWQLLAAWIKRLSRRHEWVIMSHSRSLTWRKATFGIKKLEQLKQAQEMICWQMQIVDRLWIQTSQYLIESCS